MPEAPPFREFFREHCSFVWRVLARHGVPARELPDACQEVFIVVHRRMAEFEGRSSVRTWLYGIAVRVALNTRKRAHHRRELTGVDAPETASEHDPEREFAQRQLRGRLDAALARLSEDQREVFVLYELEGMTMAEVARALGVPENTALYRLYGARDAVRAAFAREERKSESATVRKAARGMP